MTWIMIVVLTYGASTDFKHIGPFVSQVECEASIPAVQSVIKLKESTVSNIVCIPLRPNGSPNKEFD